jgi:tetratricopeptide (TPR) repeat protein
LHALSTRGLLGGAAGLAVLVAGLMTSRQAWRANGTDRATLAAWIGSSVAMLVAGAFGALGIAGAVWLAVAGGSLAAMGERREAAREPATTRGQKRGRPLPRGARVAAAILAVAMTALGAAQLLASRASFEALDWAPRGPGDGDPQRALNAAGRGPALTPWDDQAHYYRAQTLLRIAAAGPAPEALDAAEAAARRAIRLEPRRALDDQCLASVELARARLGDPAALARARQAFDQAAALAPYNALLWLQLADAEITLGDPADALPRIRHALELYPDAEVARAMLERAQAAQRAATPPG